MMRNTGMNKGFTLVELLVALTIAAVLTVIGLPRIREGLQQNAASRSATLVKSVFESARAQAIRTGRPYGVILHRVKKEVTPGDLLNDPLGIPQHGANYCKRLSFAQVAFDYRGDEEGAIMTYDAVTTPAAPFFIAPATTAGLLYGVASNSISSSSRPLDTGSIIRLGEKATPGVITAIVPVTTPVQATLVYVSPAFPVLPGNTVFRHGDQVTYSIETRPIPSPLASIDLPGKIVVDLTASGLPTNSIMMSPRSIIGSAGLPPLLGIDPALPAPSEVRGYHDVTVMFSATGQLQGIYLDQLIVPATNTYIYGKVDPVGALCLLIGEIDGVVQPETIARYPGNRGALTTWPNPPYATPFDPAVYDHSQRKLPNFANPDTSWLSINPSSGKMILKPVGTQFGLAGEVVTHPELALTHQVDVLVRDRLLDSRRLTRGAAK